MKLVYIPTGADSLAGKGDDLVRIAVCAEPFAKIELDNLNNDFCGGNNNTVLAIPQDWTAQSPEGRNIIHYKQSLPVRSLLPARQNKGRWFVISNGKFAAQITHRRFYEILTQMKADVVAVNVSPQLRASYEKALIGSKNELIGFRRLYDDMAQLAPLPCDWPHHLLIKSNVLDKLLVDGALPLAFAEFIERCDAHSISLHSLNVAGNVFDLKTVEGLRECFITQLNGMRGRACNHNWWQRKVNCAISPKARLFGEVLLGQNVRIGPDVIIAGPAIIGDNVEIEKGAVIRTSIIGPDVSVPQNHLMQNEVFIEQVNQHSGGQPKLPHASAIGDNRTIHRNSSLSGFRTWPVFSHVRCVKRAVDFTMAAVMLILFAPVMPLIALAIKLNSQGPVFFKDERQGLHGREFGCLKFRTMTVGSDTIQDKLRVANQIDGPQFKMKNDPRVTSVGRFLRCTYIDEIPQFYNVLLGQMSVVGPRPSPQSENTLCPYWRDARLSVRPGITGLWQIYGTRQPKKDFQEWIYYDTKYVRELSLKMDLLVCCKTAGKLIKNFVNQF